MCGIVGFTGTRQAAPILLDGLSKLEYRGYDSAGMAVRDGENLAQVVKAKGRLSNLMEKTDNGNALKGTCGIGHTRWATHGEPSQTNQKKIRKKQIQHESTRGAFNEHLSVQENFVKGISAYT